MTKYTSVTVRAEEINEKNKAFLLVAEESVLSRVYAEAAGQLIESIDGTTIITVEISLKSLTKSLLFLFLFFLGGSILSCGPLSTTYLLGVTFYFIIISSIVAYLYKKILIETIELNTEAVKCKQKPKIKND